MTSTAFHLTVSCAFLLLAGGPAKAELNELRAKAAAIELVRVKMGFDATHQLRASRREEWEDGLFRLQVKIKGQIAKAAYFFEVTENGYFVLSPEEAVQVSTMDGSRFWTVAVPKREDAAFGLYGFPDGESEFRRLVSDARLNVRSQSDAEAAALLFFTAVKDPRGQMIVFHSRQLKHRVENYFLAKLSEPNADSRSLAWWRGFAAAKLSDQLGLKSVPTGGGYTVSVTHTRSADGEHLELVSLVVTVSGVGACEVKNSRAIYRSPD